MSDRILHRERQSGPTPAVTDGWLPDDASLTAESALLQGLGSAGMVLVDRNLILRLQGAADGAATNPQSVEAAALRDKADLLIEIIGFPVGDADGLRYRVDAKDIRNGTAVSSFTTAAEPRSGTTPEFRTAPDHGYVEVLSGAALGRELAWEILENLTVSWK